jgi:hypothetical protein
MQPVAAGIPITIYIAGKERKGVVINSSGASEDSLLARARFIAWLRYGAPESIPYAFVHVIRR